MRIIFFLFLVLMMQQSLAQKSDDLKFIRQFNEKNIAKVQQLKPKPTVLKLQSKNYFLRYNPASLFFKGSLFFYQKIISPQISAECLFETSCSNFSKQSIQRFGLLKGLLLSSDRLMRCNRIGALDINPATISDSTGKAIDAPDFYTFRKK